MMFYVGLHQPSDAIRFDRAFVSVNRIRKRKKPIGARSWIMDSGAFTEIATHGRYRTGVEEYAAEINRWAYEGSGLVAAVAQDWMCEPWILKKTAIADGVRLNIDWNKLILPMEDEIDVLIREITPADRETASYLTPEQAEERLHLHQMRTIERYDALRPLVNGVYVMPVLQGYTVDDYLRHLDMYGDRLAPGAYVGVGSVCKRNTNVGSIETILLAIKRARPDLRLHGFGLKSTALGSALVRDALHSADSMAWSFAARRQGRDANDWREAARWAEQIASQPAQLGWGF